MIKLLLRNHVLVNLAFFLVIVLGLTSYLQLPRQKDPTMNFNWIIINTILPGASASDVEKKITDPIEDAIRKVKDVDFISSNSRESVSSILVRFQDINERVFDKRINDLRREVQNAERELPETANDPFIIEITSANAFPSASIAVIGHADDENLRMQARNIEKDLERIEGVDRVDTIGLRDPELQVVFDPRLLEMHRLTPAQVADTVAVFFQDIATGQVKVSEQNWLVRVTGSSEQPDQLANRPVLGSQGEVLLSEVANVKRAREQASQLTRVDGSPAVLMAIIKQSDTNTLDLIDRLKQYINERNVFTDQTGVNMTLVDDQTIPTRHAIKLMQTNALIGLFLVLIVTWFFLGTKISLLTAIGIPFVLAGTFWVLNIIGETLNVMVLLGIVMVLGMLVDDAVVVVEAIYYRIQRGMHAMQASLEALQEVAKPVLSAVLTTMAAFGPLTLLPGILGDFMRVVPMVVIIALAMSLIEAFWMLPAHVIVARVNFHRPSKIDMLRQRLTHKVQIGYIRVLIRAMRHQLLTLISVILMFVLSVVAIASGMIRMDFFAADTVRIFYVNVEMPASTTINNTLSKMLEIEQKLKTHLRQGEVRSVVSYAGTMFNETEQRFGEHYGQILVGLHPKTSELRSVNEMIEDIRDDIMNTPATKQISFLRLTGGPPTAKPVSIKVLGDNYASIRDAANQLKDILASIEGVKDIADDASQGRTELVLTLDSDSVNRSGLNPAEINRNLQLLVDGLVVSEMRTDGEKMEVRVLAPDSNYETISELLSFRLPLPDGTQIPLASVVKRQHIQGLGNIRHYNYRRAITVEADLDDAIIDTKTANDRILQKWDSIQNRFPDITLDQTGELDDIYESLYAMLKMFLFGGGLMYLILGTQFRSYWQPLMILSTLFMAAIGVVLGLLISRNPLSLYTLYGVVALAGIAVNSSIVLISAANQRLQSGMSVLHATLYAARRRVIPILITSLTTIAGLLSLATGLGGKSLIWGPVATAIVWGLAFSSALTMIVIPMLYQYFMALDRNKMH